MVFHVLPPLIQLRSSLVSLVMNREIEGCVTTPIPSLFISLNHVPIHVVRYLLSLSQNSPCSFVFISSNAGASANRGLHAVAR